MTRKLSEIRADDACSGEIIDRAPPTSGTVAIRDRRQLLALVDALCDQLREVIALAENEYPEGDNPKLLAAARLLVSTYND